MSEKKNKHQYNDNFKFKVALAALKGDKTIAALCKEFNLHETQITRWKKQLRDNGPAIFSTSAKPNTHEEQLKHQIKQLNEYIGEIVVENKFL